jgi:ankyrin repeat protein
LEKQKHGTRLKKFFAVCGLAGMLTLSFSGCGKVGDLLDHMPINLLPDEDFAYSLFSHENLEKVKEYVEDYGLDVNGTILDRSSLTKVTPLVLTGKDSITLHIAKYLLSQGADPNWADSEGRTVLMDMVGGALWQTYGGNFRFVKLLVENGAGIDTKSKAGLTALDYAVEGGMRDIAEYLLDNGAKVSVKTLELTSLNRYGNEKPSSMDYELTRLIFKAGEGQNMRYEPDPLFEAAVLGNSAKVVELLNQNGANEYNEYIPYFIAAYCNVEALQCIEKKGFDIHSVDPGNGYGLLPCAAEAGNLETVRYLVGRGLAINTSPEQAWMGTGLPLCMAIGNNHYDTAVYLLAQGAEFHVSDDDAPELDGAVISGNVEMLKLLEQYHYPFSDRNRHEAAKRAIDYRHSNVLKYLLDSGLDVQYTAYADGEELLEYACLDYDGQVEVLEILRGHGAVFETDESDAMANACLRGNYEIVEYLLANGMAADAHRVYEDGMPDSCGIETAIMYGYLDIIRLLVENGADIEYRDAYGGTHIMNAAQDGYHILEYFIEIGAEIDSQSDDGYTPLMCAAAMQNAKGVEVLLGAGADTGLKNNDGQTAYDMAKETKNKDIIQLFAKKQR